MSSVPSLEGEAPGLTRGRLMLQDALGFLALFAVTLALFAVTLLLFRSFEAHQAVLAQRWAQRGRTALAALQPDQAVAAYRAALRYAPGDAGDQLSLARALADAGRIDEATDYFEEMWAVHPGDGSLNLELARLARRKRDTQIAINYYRSALYGTWEGDGVERRRAIRLELADYLIAEKQNGPARAELLILGGNAPDTPAFDDALAERLTAVNAPSDALTFYRKALALAPKDLTALQAGARLALTAADYKSAQTWLTRALEHHPPDAAEDEALLLQAQQLANPKPAGTPEGHHRRHR